MASISSGTSKLRGAAVSGPVREPLPRSAQDCFEAIADYIAARNDDPKPFVWTKTADEILEKVRRGRVALDAVKQTAAQN